VVVATKFSPEHSTSGEVVRAAERSLARLGTDVIDLYQTHWPNPQVPFEDTLEGLRTLLDRGWVRCVGLSNASVRQMRACREAFTAGEFVSLQQQYNLADRHVESAQLAFCRDNGRALLAYSPLLEGRLMPDDERRDGLQCLARGLGLQVSQLILAWLLRHPEVVVIPKAGSWEHLRSNLDAADIELPPEAVARVDELYTQRVIAVEPGRIRLAAEPHRQVYQTLQDALANPAGMIPSPAQFAEELRGGEHFKPVKVRKGALPHAEYELAEGRLRYWAWIIAYGDATPIPCCPV
jgi:diketogulonate reductase-like aldo/keto reductase